jgi:outer membrane protein assembly factor BamB
MSMIAKAVQLLLCMAVLTVAGEQPWWPQFHGPQRDNISRETGQLRSWPDGGPMLVWKFLECGRGYASVVIAEGLIFTTGDFDNDEFVLALDLTGNLKWKVPNGRAWKGAQAGARTTPTYHDGIVYQMNATGRLVALEAATGKSIWTIELETMFDARHNFWGYAENVVIEGDMLLCMPGGEKGRVVALDRKTVATIWTNTEITDIAGYSSPIVVTHNGMRTFITLARQTILAVDVKTGKLLWSHEHRGTCDQNVSSPVYHNGAVVVSSGHKGGSRMVKIAPDGRSVAEMWFGTDLDNCHGGLELLNGFLYGSGCRLYKKGLVCVEFATGKTMYKASEIGKTSITYADGLLYCFGNDGSMALVEVTPQQAKVVSKFTPPWPQPSPCLAHPVVCGGRMYLRHLNSLFVYDVRTSAR